MKIGAIYPQGEIGDAGALRDFGLAMADLGVNHIVAFDHVLGAAHAGRQPPLWGPYTEQHPFHDPFVMFAYLAGLTPKLEFTTGVLVLPQRQTALVAKQATDLDLVSGQRLRLGVGAGWNYVEYQALGQDFHTRGKRLDEQIELLRLLWREPLVTFNGQFDQIERANLNLRPKRQIPIWIGGFTEPAFRRGARLGDGFIFSGALENVAEAWTYLKGLLPVHGRSVETYGAELLVRTGSVGNTVEVLKRWRDLGGTHGSIRTTGQDFKSIEQHIDYVRGVMAAL